MGSLNGDIMVMRNGRSTNQVSVYNYPEHLNPFYEDDQHKRLRFWKISKKDNDGRRNSFSIANLKDMWAFKSFRMKKKSSTLGINKTSESPPLLRRDYALDNSWNTFDNRLRASNTSSINGDNFQRNATYRSSLQTIPTTNDRIGLNRNDGYRSTIQVPRSNTRYMPQQKHHLQSNLGVSPNRRYVYGGSVTPQPLRYSRLNIGRGPYEYDSDNAMLRGSSQTSMASTNPFESDGEETEEFKSQMSSILNGSITTLTSRTPRKKRRAPAPPTPIHGSNNNAVPVPTIRIDSSHNNTQDELLHINEDMDIANLTAEIESYVKTKSNDDVEESPQVERHTTTRTTAGNSENLQIEEQDERQPQPINVANTTTTTNNIITEDITILPKETINTTDKLTNGQVTNETVTTPAYTNINSEVIEPKENLTKSAAHITSEIETDVVESKEDVKTNGAIPKKPNNIQVPNNSNASEQQQQLAQTKPTVADLCIRETCTEVMPVKPIPLKRQTKPDTEVGHVECIHVHVESPKASPRQDHSSDLTSFKASETVQPNDDTITIKTPFVLTSPPSQRRKQQQLDSVECIRKETVKIVEPPNVTNSQLTNELNIQEDCIPNKPEILVKPTLSPKPVTKETNGKPQGYADIHKPTRRHHLNGQPAKVLREGSISPPCVPQHGPVRNDEEKLNNTDHCQHNNNGRREEKSAAVKQLQFEHLDNLKIVEHKVTTKISSELKKEEEGERIKDEMMAKVQEEEAKQDDEFDALYRSKPTSHMEWKRSTLAPLETHIPPEKRKSVKDIIESINRSQRLLNAAANKDFPALQNQKYQPSLNHHNGNSNYNNNNSNNNLNEDLKILNQQQEEFLQCSNNNMAAAAANSPSPSPSNDYNDNNNEIFQKCKVNKEVFDYRETSPITSNLDWNPVPKPKRTKAAQE